MTRTATACSTRTAVCAKSSDTMTRLNKFLGESGLCSRREADALIAAGRVRVNGSVAGLGVQVGERDRVELDGRLVRAARPEQAVYIA